MEGLIPKYEGTRQLLNQHHEKAIIFRHSHIAITDYHMGDNREFERSLSRWDKMRWKYELLGGYYVKALREFRINRAFNIEQLKHFFPDYEFKVENCAYPYDEIDIQLLTPPRDDLQRMTLTFMASEGKFKNNAKFTQQMIENPVGTGKTYCGTAITAYMKTKTLIIVPLAKLLNQWKESFILFTGMDEDDILIVKGSKTCNKILEGKYKHKNVFIFMVDTIYSFNKQYGDIKTMDMLASTRCHTKIVDEIHLDLKAISMIEALSNFRMNYYMSASAGRSEQKENWIFKNLFTHIPRFGSNFQTKDEKHLNIMVKKYYFTPTPRQIKRMVSNKTGLNTKAYETELRVSPAEQRVNFEDQLKIILKWTKKNLKDENKIIIFGQSIEFLYYLQTIVEEVYPNKTSVYYGGMKKDEKEKALHSDIIIATTASLGTGADIKGLQFGINCSTYSSWISVKQISGRLRKLPDETPTVYIEMVNFGYIKTVKQFEKRKPYLVKASKDEKILMVN